MYCEVDLELESEATVSEHFCLGIRDFCCCETCTGLMSSKKKQRRTSPAKENKGEPACKKLCLSLKGKSKVRQRFADITNEDEFGELSKGYVPPNTDKNTDSAMRVFQQWRESRSARGAKFLISLSVPTTWSCSPTG